MSGGRSGTDARAVGTTVRVVRLAAAALCAMFAAAHRSPRHGATNASWWGPGGGGAGAIPQQPHAPQQARPQAGAHDGHSCIQDQLMADLGRVVGHHERHLATQTRQRYHAHDHGNRTTFEFTGRGLQSATYAPIRIHIDTSQLDVGADPFACQVAGSTVPNTLGTFSTDVIACQAADVLDDAKRAFIRNELISAALDLCVMCGVCDAASPAAPALARRPRSFSNTLSVIPVVGNLVLDAPWPDSWCFQDGFAWRHFMCCESYWPQQYRSPGIAEKDYVIMLTGRPTRESLLAWALECMSDQVGRPTAGHVNLSPARVSSDAKEFQYQLAVIMHEIMHALGFNSNKFPFFRKPGTLTQVDSVDEVLFRGTDTDLGKTVTRIITPKVVAAAKAHYGCFEWPNAGMEIEDGGGGGTAGSHWEKRVAMYDIMNGVSERAMYKSSLTLALFEDSGWYAVDYTRAERLPWGNGEGCIFVTKKCNQWSNRYFCSAEGELGCTSDMRFGAQCTASTDAISRPSQFQYFSTPFKGGISSISDYCPYYQGYTNRDCSDASTVQFFYYGERAGSGARCFKGTYQLRSVSATPRTHSGCLQTACDPLTNSIMVTLASTPPTVVRCPRAGGEVDLGTLEGSAFAGIIVCPRSDLLCSGDACALNDCSGHGVCNPADGTCVCNAGYYGADNFTCTYKRCPTAVPGVDCSGHGLCNRATGSCEDGTGLVGCYAGFKTADCSVRGCPSFASPDCSGGTGPCECAGRGTCSNGTCACSAGYVGSGCQYTDCPAGINGTRCSGVDHGDCDITAGLCACANAVPVPGSVTGATVYYTGASCAVTGLGTRPIARLHFQGEVNATTNMTLPALSGGLVEKTYEYYYFDVTSTEYRLNLALSTGTAAAVSLPRLIASYATSGLPSIASAEFVSSGTNQANTQGIEFAPSTTATLSRFNRLGRIYVAAVAMANTTYNLTLSRDGCSTLRCVFGRCSDGVCLCEPGWSGTLCADPDCPGTPDCGNRGRCETAGAYSGGLPVRGRQPACNCSTYFTGLACEQVALDGFDDSLRLRFSSFLVPTPGMPDVGFAATATALLVKNRATNVVVVNQSLSGEMDVGSTFVPTVIDPADLRNHINDSFAVYMTLDFSASPAADGVMLARENVPPTLDMVGVTSLDFDVTAWRQHAKRQEILHRITPNDASTLYFVRIFNGRYGEERLKYSWRLELSQGACPPSIASCSGHGTCEISTYTCRCERGYRGLRCEIPVAPLDLLPPLPAVDGVVVDGTILVADASLSSGAPGTWQYFSLDTSPSHSGYEVELTLAARRSAAVLLAAFEPTRSSSSVSLVTSESAFFDYDGVANGTSRQLLQLRRKPSEVSLLIGVFTSVTTRAELAGTIRVTAHVDTLTRSCGSSDTSCQAAACHQRGAYVTDASGAASCRCQKGWADEADCAAPQFASLSRLLTASQRIGTLCTVCSTRQTLAAGEIQIVTVPPALQKRRYLVMSVAPVTSTAAAVAQTPGAVVGAGMAGQPGSATGNVTVGVPALLVSPYFPRSILDYVLIASGDGSNATLTLGSSTSGMHYASVYAHVGGAFRVSVARAEVAITEVVSPSFASQLSRWLFATVAGNIVMGIGAALTASVLLGCALQCITYRSLDARVRESNAAMQADRAKAQNMVDMMQFAMANEERSGRVFGSRPALQEFARRSTRHVTMSSAVSTLQKYRMRARERDDETDWPADGKAAGYASASRRFVGADLGGHDGVGGGGLAGGYTGAIGSKSTYSHLRGVSIPAQTFISFPPVAEGQLPMAVALPAFAIAGLPSVPVPPPTGALVVGHVVAPPVTSAPGSMLGAAGAGFAAAGSRLSGAGAWLPHLGGGGPPLSARPPMASTLPEGSMPGTGGRVAASTRSIVHNPLNPMLGRGGPPAAVVSGGTDSKPAAAMSVGAAAASPTGAAMSGAGTGIAAKAHGYASTNPLRQAVAAAAANTAGRGSGKALRKKKAKAAPAAAAAATPAGSGDSSSDRSGQESEGDDVGGGGGGKARKVRSGGSHERVEL